VIQYLLFPVIVIMLIYMVRHYLFSYFALFRAPKQRSYQEVAGLYRPLVSILIPCHNEERVIGHLLDRLVATTYPKEKLEIIPINDGSTDATGQILDEYAAKHPFIKPLHRGNGGHGKAAALNDGLKVSKGEIILTFDADYLPQYDIVEKLVVPFVDPEVGGVQGRVTVYNENESFVSRLVTLERIGGYRVDQVARDRFGLIPQYGGTVGGFRRDLLEAFGGWDENMLAEDTDLTAKTVLEGYKVRYVLEAESYEEAVTSWKAYWRQRYRWAKGHMQCALRHTIPTLKTKQLTRLQKLDMLLFLWIYFAPILVFLGWVVGIAAFLTEAPPILPFYVGTLSVFTYSAVGNFAPFFEVGLGVYLDRRKSFLWLLPGLLLAFFLNVLLCTLAFLDLLVRRNGRHRWIHTTHNGNGYHEAAAPAGGD
jgi:cellulose synthase/poly-beta-1,6-N-acetylglucosamine synthase-like glycosyltransferase